MKKKIILSTVSALMLLTSCTTVEKKQYPVVQMEEKERTVIAEEVIVTKITEEGYVVKHGDHYHYVKGKVPAHAKIRLEEANHTDHYQFNPSDVVEETSDGYVVRHGDHYHYIYKKDVKVNTASTIKISNQEDHDHEDEYVFNPADIISETENGYIVRHGNHQHFIFKKDVPWYNPSKKVENTGNHNSKDTTKEVDFSVYLKEINEYVAKYKVTNKDIKIQDNVILIWHVNHYHAHTSELKDWNKFLEKYPDYKYGETTNNSNHDEEADILAKKNYIVEVYGVPFDAIRVTEDFFIFNDPGHAYDPTHIHPYFIKRSSLIIPVVTGEPEIDFENELLSVSHRTGIPPHKLKVENGYFVLPHDDHNHYVKVKALNGMKPYYDNQLPKIKGDYVSGEFDLSKVVGKVKELEEKAKDKFKDEPTVFRRIERALDAFEEELSIPTNSTQGYIKMLDRFEKEHINHEKVDEEANEQEVAKLNALYNSLVEQINAIKDRPLTNEYKLSKIELIKELQSYVDAKDMKNIQRMERMIKGIQRVQSAPSQMDSVVISLDYLLKAIDSPYLTKETREKTAELIIAIYRGNDRWDRNKRAVFKQLVPEYVELKHEIKGLIEKGVEVEFEYGENYLNFLFGKIDQDPKTWREKIVWYLGEQKPFILRHKLVRPEELAEGFELELPPMKDIKFIP